MKQTVSMNVDGKEVTIESGRMAKQADGSVIVSSGNNMVLVTAVSSKRPTTLPFFPLTVEFQEKFYSTGRIPGGYFKREGRPNGEALLTCRLIDLQDFSISKTNGLQMRHVRFLHFARVVGK